MDFKEIQEKAIENLHNYSKRHEVKIDEEFALVKLFEEVGEFAQAALIHKKKCRKVKLLPEDESKAELAKELADVVGMAIVNAHMFDIDLEDALKKKWIDKH